MLCFHLPNFAALGVVGMDPTKCYIPLQTGCSPPEHVSVSQSETKAAILHAKGKHPYDLSRAQVEGSPQPQYWNTEPYVVHSTLRKIHIEPERHWVVEENSLPKVHFQVPC